MLMQATIKEVVSFLSPDIEERSRVPDYILVMNIFINLTFNSYVIISSCMELFNHYH